MVDEVTFTQGQKGFLKLIKKVNEDKYPVMVKAVKGRRRGTVVICEDDWNAIQETILLVNQDVDKQIKKQENNADEDFDKLLSYQVEKRY